MQGIQCLKGCGASIEDIQEYYCAGSKGCPPYCDTFTP